MRSAIVVGLLLLAITSQHSGPEFVTHDCTRAQLSPLLPSRRLCIVRWYSFDPWSVSVGGIGGRCGSRAAANYEGEGGTNKCGRSQAIQLCSVLCSHTFCPDQTQSLSQDDNVACPYEHVNSTVAAIQVCKFSAQCGRKHCAENVRSCTTKLQNAPPWAATLYIPAQPPGNAN